MTGIGTACQIPCSPIRAHADDLAKKTYWQVASEPAPEFTILFLPGEAFFSAALESDPRLIDDAAAKGVILATPTTLIAMLKGIAYGWREARMADNAREISELASSLYERLGTLASHFGELGAALDRAVLSYNGFGNWAPPRDAVRLKSSILSTCAPAPCRHRS